MKILALENELPGVSPEAFQPLLKAEAMRIWELQQSGRLRETYFRSDRSAAVLVLECKDVDEAQKLLSTLPLVTAGLITFDIIPLAPYNGLARLFV
jgi:muconolactone delta-isomerase